MKNNKPDCYKCKYRRHVPGSCHLACAHPSVAPNKADPMAALMAIFASVGRVAPVTSGLDKLDIKINNHGLKNGWANWPFNFDPIWLDNCNAYKPLKYPYWVVYGRKDDIDHITITRHDDTNTKVTGVYTGKQCVSTNWDDILDITDKLSDIICKYPGIGLNEF